MKIIPGFKSLVKKKKTQKTEAPIIIFTPQLEEATFLISSLRLLEGHIQSLTLRDYNPSKDPSQTKALVKLKDRKHPNYR